MASIELDIIKQRCDKLMPEEKRELIEYLSASLADKENEPVQNLSNVDQNENGLTGETLDTA
jgi:hypothetical protein